MNEDIAIGIAIFLVFAGIGLVIALPIFAFSAATWFQ